MTTLLITILFSCNNHPTEPLSHIDNEGKFITQNYKEYRHQKWVDCNKSLIFLNRTYETCSNLYLLPSERGYYLVDKIEADGSVSYELGGRNKKIVPINSSKNSHDYYSKCVFSSNTTDAHKKQ